jgi:hypothetical protein
MTEPKVPGGTWEAPRDRMPLDMGADPVAVKQLMAWLVARFEEYVSEHETNHADAMMAVHNFHKVIIFDLITRTGMDAEAARFFRQMAGTTFSEAMRRGR